MGSYLYGDAQVKWFGQSQDHLRQLLSWNCNAGLFVFIEASHIEFTRADFGKSPDHLSQFFSRCFIFETC